MVTNVRFYVRFHVSFNSYKKVRLCLSLDLCWCPCHSQPMSEPTPVQPPFNGSSRRGQKVRFRMFRHNDHKADLFLGRVKRFPTLPIH